MTDWWKDRAVERQAQVDRENQLSGILPRSGLLEQPAAANHIDALVGRSRDAAEVLQVPG